MEKNKSYKSIRLFKNDYLEFFTHIPPLLPICFWSPIVLFLFAKGITQHDLVFVEVMLVFLSGLFSWTLSEYILHRFVFHFKAKRENVKKLVYLFHGIHHEDPQDPTRLLFPPLPGLMLFFLLYVFFSVFITGRYILVFMGSFAIGYLVYDYIHYATHHLKMNSKVGRFLKTYHLKHHFSEEDMKFGVSNPLWDLVFQTYKK